jgi:hypothetical protein
MREFTARTVELTSQTVDKCRLSENKKEARLRVPRCCNSAKLGSPGSVAASGCACVVLILTFMRGLL